jgi:uncharacterized iron-regulated membrane protein
MTISKQQLRRTWFQVHKWLGLTLALLVTPISLTGAALVWHDALDGALIPERRTNAQAVLPPSAYADAARALAAPGERLLSLSFPEGSGAVVATLARPVEGAGRPVRTLLHLDPSSARLLDRSASNEGVVRVLHVLHGSLMIPGAGRQVVGWIGVAMLISALTGLWLWWPVRGGFRRGFRWNRQPTTSGNLHHLGGFWIALPLAVLSFTGAWISFPAFFAQVSGDAPPASAAERARRSAPAPLEQTALSPGGAIAAAERFAPGELAAIGWPTQPKAEWKVSYRRDGGLAEVLVDDSTGTATAPKPPQPETTARLMRRIHDGTGMGRLWQSIIFMGGIVPAMLGITGALMWLNVRKRRRAMERKRRGGGAASAATA